MTPPPPPLVIPLVLQVFPLPGLSDLEEFFYDCSPDAHQGPFAAAHAFFLEQSYKEIVHNWVDIAAFQAACPFGTILCPLDDLPCRVFTGGYLKLQQLVIAAAIATPDEPAVPAGDILVDGTGAFLSSLLDCYADIPLVLLLAFSSQGGRPSGPPLVVGYSFGPPLVAGAFNGGPHPSCWPDPEGFDVPTSLPSSL